MLSPHWAEINNSIERVDMVDSLQNTCEGTMLTQTWSCSSVKVPTWKGLHLLG